MEPGWLSIGTGSLLSGREGAHPGFFSSFPDLLRNPSPEMPTAEPLLHKRAAEATITKEAMSGKIWLINWPQQHGVSGWILRTGVLVQ